MQESHTGPALPMLEPQGAAELHAQLAHCSAYLEYGCGGSTVEAARSGVPWGVSVDTDEGWLARVGAQLHACQAHWRLVHCNLGPVVAWGYPATVEHFAQFHRYPIAPWDAARAAGVTPDLVLVDGRFRVACLLYSLASAAPGTVILVDDYVNRPEYGVVEEFCRPLRTAGRMARFEAPGAGACTPALLRRFAEYCAVPR